MQKRKFNSILSIMLFVMLVPIAAAANTTEQQDTTVVVRKLLQDIIDVNAGYKSKFNTKVSAEILKQQTPSTTAVLCSDSRVDTDAVNDSPVGQMFVVRNIGNQVQTAYGSVEYGVYHLHTHLLLVVGHSECGAVKAAMQDYSGESDRIRSELDSLVVDAHATLNENIVHNVNNQVSMAVTDFGDRVNSGDVVIVGLVYDLHNDFKMGNGQLLLVNINNETDPKVLANSPYLKGLKNVQILGNKPDSAVLKAKP